MLSQPRLSVEFSSCYLNNKILTISVAYRFGEWGNRNIGILWDRRPKVDLMVDKRDHTSKYYIFRNFKLFNENVVLRFKSKQNANINCH